jgi:hypothetical protein
MSRFQSGLASALITLAFAHGPGAGSAMAAGLPASAFAEEVGGGSYLYLIGDTTTPEYISGSSLLPGYAYVSGWAQTVGGSLPTASGLINITADNDVYTVYGGIHARVEYHWMVEQIGGDAYSGSVPIDVQVSGGIDSSAFLRAGPNNLYAQAYVPLPGTPGSYMVNACSTSTCTVGRLTFEESVSGMALVDRAYRVVLTASGSGAATYVGSTFTLSAWVDPRIEISPGFDRRDDFRLVFSNGISPVPEPATAGLALAGLIVVLGAARKRRCAPQARA